MVVNAEVLKLGVLNMNVYKYPTKVEEALLKYEKKNKIKAYLGNQMYIIDMPADDSVIQDKYFTFTPFNASVHLHKRPRYFKSRRCKLFVNNVLHDKQLIVNKLVSLKGAKVHTEDDEHVIEVVFKNKRQRDEQLLFYESLPSVVHVECIHAVKPNIHHAYDVVFRGHDNYKGRIQNIEQHVYGEGDIVTVIDTGLDTSHCMFSDPVASNAYVRYKLNRFNGGSQLKSALATGSHKVLYGYAALTYKNSEKDTDFVDEQHGHGTHTSGTVVMFTSEQCKTLDARTSFTPKMKLFFIDVQRNIPEKKEKEEEGEEEEEEEKGHLDLPGSFAWVLNAIKSIDSNIISCSFGSSNSTMYSILSYEMDKFIYENPHISIVVAAGNSGPERGTISSPGDAKNVITVGATSNTMESFLEYAGKFKVQDEFSFNATHVKEYPSYYKENNLADFSSRGPTFDGRIKPDVVAPGSFVMSADARMKSDSMLLMRGTSMSTPVVANALAMINTVLHKKYKKTEIEHDLRKAILIAFSIPLQGYEQSWKRDPVSHHTLLSNINHPLKKLDAYDQGYGRVSLSSFIDEGCAFTTNSIHTTSNAHFTYYQAKESQIDQLRVVMSYSDPPSVPGSMHALVNDLNLRVFHFEDEARTVRVYEGNGKLDGVNNVEVVDIPRVSIGDYIVVHVGVKGVISNKQKYSIAINTQLMEVSPFPPIIEEKIVYIRDLMFPTQCITHKNTIGMYDEYNKTCITPPVYTLKEEDKREKRRLMSIPVKKEEEEMERGTIVHIVDTIKKNMEEAAAVTKSNRMVDESLLKVLVSYVLLPCVLVVIIANAVMLDNLKHEP